MLVINYSLSFKALDKHIRAYNNNQDTLAKKIRQSTSATAKDIIRMYGRKLARENDKKALDLENLPSFTTSNGQLAKACNASSRTIQRHIKKLQEAGIISEKKWHGSNRGFELWITSKIMLVGCGKSLEQAINYNKDMLPEKEVVTKKYTTTCPYSDASNKSYEINLKYNSLIGVHNIKNIAENSAGNASKRCSLPLTKPSFSGNKIAGYTGEKVLTKKIDAGEKVRARVETSEDGKVRVSGSDKARLASLNLYVSLLWSLAKNALYANVFLTERQCEIALQLIRTWYEPVANESLANAHRIYIERIGLVQKYLERDQNNRYVQLPHLYFDTTNPNGFAGTKKWWQAHRQRKLEVRAKLIVHAQIRRYLHNETLDTGKRKPSLQLFRDCETRIKQLNNPELLQKFHTSVLNPIISTNHYVNY